MRGISCKLFRQVQLQRIQFYDTNLATILLCIGLSHLFTSCSQRAEHVRPRTFDQFDFSYSETFTTSYTIQFTSGDTVYIRQHWASFEDSLKSERTYYGVIPKASRHQLDSFLVATPLARYKESYEEGYVDGETYAFYWAKDSLRQYTYVHADTVPAPLYAFSRWLIQLKKSTPHYPIDTTLRLGSDGAFDPIKIVPPDMKRFTPPVVEY